MQVTNPVRFTCLTFVCDAKHCRLSPKFLSLNAPDYRSILLQDKLLRELNSSALPSSCFLLEESKRKENSLISLRYLNQNCIAMVSAEVIRNVFGVLGNIIALFMFLSPLPTFVKIWKAGSVEQFSPVPYLASFINCMVWSLYGLPMVHPKSTLVVTINGTGTVIEIVFLFLFILYSDKKGRIKVLLVILVEVIFVTVLSVLVLTVVHGTKKRTLIVGTICIMFNIIMYAAPLSIMRMVIRTKSVEYMPFYLSLASFANGACWTIYALMPFDAFIVAPNGSGTVLALAQLLLYAMYYKSTQRQIAAREGKGELGLSEIVVNGGSKAKIDGGSRHSRGGHESNGA